MAGAIGRSASSSLLWAWTSISFQRIVRRSYVTISPGEATAILQQHEHTEEINYNAIKSFDTNQLPSNNPVEVIRFLASLYTYKERIQSFRDRSKGILQMYRLSFQDARTEGRAMYTTGMLFGIFDGHGGPSCAQVVAKRLFSYIAASMLPSNMIKDIINNPQRNKSLLQLYNDNFELVEDLSTLYAKSFDAFLRTLEGRPKGEFHMEDALMNSFVALDNDITEEAKLEKLDQSRKVKPGSLHLKTLSVALSGAVGCVAHVDYEHLHVASAGDCKVALGNWDSEHEQWTAHVITQDHNADNTKEVNRLLGEHPDNERDSIIRNDRLFGQLVPLRAFGDVRFKWSAQDIRDYLVPVLGEQAIMLSSRTPPYVTARPDVFYHKLRASDKFMILASDGLWDLLSPSQVVRLVGEHMFGKITLKPFNIPEKGSVSLGKLHSTLSSRMDASKLKPTDANSATHLIRHALGGTEHGFDNQRLCQLLTLPDESVRLFRDDISATIVFFDSDFISSRPL